MEAKSFEEHLRYLHEIVRLKLWFVREWVGEHPDEGLSFALRHRVNIFGKTVFWSGEGFPTEAEFDASPWPELERRLQRIYEETRADADSSRFEDAAFEVLREAVDGDAPRSFGAGVSAENFQCGSLGYASPTPEHPELVRVHIANVVQPRSIFDDREYLPQCFFRLMDEVQEKFAVEILATATWLNCYPRWLELFPTDFLDNMNPADPDVRGNMGFWGQFVNARGVLNEKHARVFRETGRFPYARRYSWCSFDSMREHLERYLRE